MEPETTKSPEVPWDDRPEPPCRVCDVRERMEETEEADRRENRAFRAGIKFALALALGLYGCCLFFSGAWNLLKTARHVYRRYTD